MKNNINYIWFVFLLLTTTNCSEDLLEKDVYGITTSENFYKNEEQIKQAVTEIYSKIRGVAYQNLPTLHFFIGDITTDDALKGGGSEADFNEGLQMQNFTNSSANFMIAAQWSNAYVVINRSNIVIEKAPNAAGDSEKLQQYVNEAKFLRAWAYFKLATVFGGVPLLVKDVPANEAYIARTSEGEVFEQIYKDLTDATELPTRSEYPPSEMGRATSGAAWALMGKAYMFQQNFTKAEEALKKVVQSGEYELNPEFGWNFDYEHRNSKESVFSIQFKEIIGVYNTGLQLVQFFSSRTTEGGWGFHVPTQDLWDAYDNDDPRLTYTFIRSGDRFGGDNYDQNEGMSLSGYHDRKIFVRRADITTYNNNVSKNWEIIRYSDVLLMLAEALNENGKSAEALEYINAVRERARNTNPFDPKREKQAYVPPTDPATSLPDITTTNQAELRQLIWHERRLELAMEGHRRYDLVRQKRYGEVMRAYSTKYNTDKGKLFDDSRDYLMPIPDNEILLSQGKLTQNPGF